MSNVMERILTVGEPVWKFILLCTANKSYLAPTMPSEEKAKMRETNDQTSTEAERDDKDLHTIEQQHTHTTFISDTKISNKPAGEPVALAGPVNSLDGASRSSMCLGDFR